MRSPLQTKYGVTIGTIAGALLLASLLAPPLTKAEAKSLESMRWQPLQPLPDPHGFACPIVGIGDDCPIVAGASNFPNAPLWEKGAKGWHDRIFLYDAQASFWRIVGQSWSWT